MEGPVLLAAIIVLLIGFLLMYAGPKLRWALMAGLGFVAIVSAGVLAQGMPAGLIGGIVVGGLFALLNWFRYKGERGHWWRKARNAVARTADKENK